MAAYAQLQGQFPTAGNDQGEYWEPDGEDFDTFVNSDGVNYDETVVQTHFVQAYPHAFPLEPELVPVRGNQQFTPYSPDNRRYPDAIEHVLIPIYPEYRVNETAQSRHRNDILTVRAAQPQSQHQIQYHNEVPTEHSVSEGNIRITGVMLAFTDAKYVQSRQTWKNWMAWLTERTTGEFIHVEMVFKIIKLHEPPESREGYVCCTIYYGEPVRWEEKKQYDRVKNKWKIYAIRCTDEQLLELYHFCDAQIGKQFNKAAFYLNFLPVWGLGWIKWDSHGSKWLCSELALTALQQVFPELRQYTACKTTVTGLMEITEKHGMFIVDTLYSYTDFAQRIQYASV